MGKNHKVSLERLWICCQKKIKMTKFINDELEFSSDNSDDDLSDKKTSEEE